MTTHDASRVAARRQRGAAALVVVLMLFFIVSMVAAYTSRSMIFEQRTSTNQYRSTQAIEAAEAGLEWGIAKLNAGRLNAACATDAAGANTFRERYLVVAPSTGVVTPVAGASATCVRAGSAWNCTCPTAGTSMPATSGDGPFPGFRLHFVPDEGVGARAQAIRLTVNACTNASDACLALPQTPEPGQGNASVSVMVGLKGAITTIPAAAVTLPAATTAAASLTLSGGSRLRAFNSQSGSSGIAIQAGGTLPAVDLTAVGPPGMPSELAKLESDLSLAANSIGGGLRNSADAGACGVGATHPGCSFNRMFTGIFGAPRATYRDQPALVRCDAGCTASSLAALAAKNPRSVLWVAGNVTLDSSLGSAGDPVAIVAEGDVAIAGAGTVITGLIYGTSGIWTVTGTPLVQGAIVSERAATLGGGGTLDVRYDAAVLARLRNEVGSFTRVPGSWRDWQP